MISLESISLLVLYRMKSWKHGPSVFSSLLSVVVLNNLPHSLSVGCYVYFTYCNEPARVIVLGLYFMSTRFRKLIPATLRS